MQPYRKSAAGRSGHSRVRSKHRSHTLRVSCGLGNPVLRFALVMRSCLYLQRDIAVLAGTLRKKIRRLFHPLHLVRRGGKPAL